jgi:hypothetical protein
MKTPSNKMLSILKNKLNRYGDSHNKYFGGLLTYYEIKVLLYHMKIKLDRAPYRHAKYFINEYQKKGTNDSLWFYFELIGNEKAVEKLGI